MTPYETILVETRGRVGWITLNRPEALNALNTQVMWDVVAAASAFDADEGIGAIVLTGSERAFAAGADIKEMESKSGLEMLMGDHFGGWAQFAAVRTPVIAAVSGYALGGGCELAMMCDIIIAADTAKFGQPEINLGVIPGMGGSQRLIRAVGYYKAADLILTGRMMDAAEAERAGLVSRVVPAADLLDEAGKIAETIAVEVAAVGVRREGGAGCGDGDHARRGPALRAPRLRVAVRHRRPEGGHVGLPREAQPGLHEPVSTEPEGQSGSGIGRGSVKSPASLRNRARIRTSSTMSSSASAASANTSVLSACVARSTRSRPASREHEHRGAAVDRVRLAHDEPVADEPVDGVRHAGGMHLQPRDGARHRHPSLAREAEQPQHLVPRERQRERFQRARRCAP